MNIEKAHLAKADFTVPEYRLIDALQLRIGALLSRSPLGKALVNSVIQRRSNEMGDEFDRANAVKLKVVTFPCSGEHAL